jgi:hypothetical protein
MGIVESALKILELCSHLIAIAKDVTDTASPSEKAHATEQIWKEISDIAAEQAAKPEIQGYSEHE